jgi:hypothetical protein
MKSKFRVLLSTRILKSFKKSSSIAKCPKSSTKELSRAIKPSWQGREPGGVDGEGEGVSVKACGEKCKGILRIIFLNLSSAVSFIR